ncbi:MAG: FAD-dependent oxidoreductase [Chloroflexota bacterium]
MVTQVQQNFEDAKQRIKEQVQSRNIEQRESPPLVGIVGTGLSALISAFILISFGYRVVLFGKDKWIGGRILTWRPYDSYPQQFAEAGLMRISSSAHPEMTFFIKDVFELETMPFHLNKRLVLPTGMIDIELSSYKDWKPLLSSNDTQHPSELVKRMYRELDNVYNAGGVQALIELAEEESNLSWTKKFYTDRTAHTLLSYLGIEARSHLSVIESYLHRKVGHYRDLYYMTDGSDALVRALVNELEASDVCIYSEATVNAIHSRANDIEMNISYDNDSIDKPNAIIVDHVIVTAPLPAVNRITITWDNEPAFEFSQAIEKTHYTAGLKILAMLNSEFIKHWKMKPGQQISTMKGLHVIVSPAGQHRSNFLSTILNYTWSENADKDRNKTEQEQLEYLIKRLTEEIAPFKHEWIDEYFIADWSKLSEGIGPAYHIYDFNHLWNLKRRSNRIILAGDWDSYVNRRWGEASMNSAIKACASIIFDEPDFTMLMNE